MNLYNTKPFKVFISLYCVLAIFISSAFNALAKTYMPSDWAWDIVYSADKYNLIPPNTSSVSYTDNISRIEFCHYAITLYSAFSGKQMPSKFKSTFIDTDDKNVLYASDLGIINGRGEGVFSPHDLITRQEMSVIISRLLDACDINVSVSKSEKNSILNLYKDEDDVKDWAIDSVAFCVKNGIIKGMSQNELLPNNHTTREQAIVIIYRCFDAFATDKQKEGINFVAILSADGDYENLKATVSGGAKLVSYDDRTVNISFSPIKNATKYKIDVYLDGSNFWYQEEDIFVKTIYSNTNTASIKNIRAGKRYALKISDEDGNKTQTASVYVAPLYTLDEKEKIVFSHGEMVSKESADNVMKKIQINAWRMKSNGEKYPSKMYLTVHKSIANITKAAFEEIFKSEHKFPIKDIGAYSWRDSMSSGRYSHHNYGTAIDINYNENYCLYKDGSYVGVGWFPGVNAYSIAADSDIVSIFAKYGFVWGGDEWSNPKDYMHFSYLEM